MVFIVDRIEPRWQARLIVAVVMTFSIDTAGVFQQWLFQIHYVESQKGAVRL
jgi:hypothetical protein